MDAAVGGLKGVLCLWVLFDSCASHETKGECVCWRPGDSSTCTMSKKPAQGLLAWFAEIARSGPDILGAWGVVFRFLLRKTLKSTVASPKHTFRLAKSAPRYR